MCLFRAPKAPAAPAAAPPMMAAPPPPGAMPGAGGGAFGQTGLSAAARQAGPLAIRQGGTTQRMVAGGYDEMVTLRGKQALTIPGPRAY